MHLIAGLFAVVLLALVLQDAFEVMLLPRRINRRVRFMGIYFRAAWAAWSQTARLLSPGRGREGFLSHFGALSMLGLFAIWAGTLILSFGLLYWSLQQGSGSAAAPSPLAEQVYMSGVTFFTLGYGDVVPHTGLTQAVAVFEAGTGIGFIAVVIGYLPVLYQLFSRREAHVIQLDGRAGSPPTAVALLCRHAESEGLDKLDELLRQWEIWGSELLESHLSYPMLAYYRSQHDNQSWLAATAAVMDCCALILVGVKGLAPLQARMTFSMARQVIVEMSRSFRVKPSPFDGGDRLPPEAYARMQRAFEEAGVEWQGGADTRDALHALRATYEPLLDGLARHLLLAIPAWLPDEDATDHWERGHRGLLARRLVEQLADRAVPPMSLRADEGDARTWRRLHRTLRQ